MTQKKQSKVDKYLNMSNYDVEKMTRKQLSDMVTVLNSAANKRLRRLEKTPMGTESVPYQNAMKRGGFSVKGKNINQLRNEFKAVREFMGAKTSSVKGWKKFRKETAKRIGGGFDNSDNEMRFWKLFRLIRQADPGAVAAAGSDTVLKELRKTMRQYPDKTDEDILRYTLDNLTKMYEENQEDVYGDENFFTVDDGDADADNGEDLPY